jgi:NADH-quinone oxidoreductase subunit A
MLWPILEGFGMPDLVLLILIFLAAGLTVLASNLVLGRLIRPYKPSPEKGEVYECGEQPIGTAWVQFDLRFYVVALLFVIFDVELAFFFPWAVVFGSANRAADESQPVAVRNEARDAIQPQPGIDKNTGSPISSELSKAAVPNSKDATPPPPDPQAMKKLAWISFADILVFFGVLLVGFAYLWRRGDLKWVRSVAAQV